MSDGTTEQTAALIALPGVLDGVSAVRALSAAVARRPARTDWVRIEQRVTGVDPWAWVRGQRGRPRLVWIDRDGRRGMVGIGTTRTADEALTNLTTETTETTEGADLRWLATVRFAPGAPDAPDAEEWRAFGRARRMLPRIELRWCDGGQTLACHVDARRDGDAARAVAALAALAPAEITTPSTTMLHLEPEAAAHATWSAAVQRVLARIDDGTLDKAVVARRVLARAPAPLDPIDVLHRLHTSQPDTFAIAIDHGADGALVAVSPELLFHRHRRDVASEALAGTAPRGDDDADDERRGRALLHSDKDRREHDLVVAHVVARLTPLCDDVHAGAPELRRLRYAQHLRTPVRARLKPGRGDADLLGALHPTPATCGMPPTAAHAAIRAAEDFDRGLYGGAVAWSGRHETTCAVALRSALLRGRDAWLFAGAGIVAGSDPDVEWRETETKLAAFAPVLDRGER